MSQQSQEPRLGRLNCGGRPVPIQSLPLCGAKTRAGTPCKHPGSKRNGRCRRHGMNAGAPPGKANGNFRTGKFTAEAMAERRKWRALVRTVREWIRQGG